MQIQRFAPLSGRSDTLGKPGAIALSKIYREQPYMALMSLQTVYRLVQMHNRHDRVITDATSK